ncbi:RNA polymerase sigma factor [Aequorivita capsosiphonis]|uniref:RNA polymerase sigma factor n=1 Tax=Aequorivita capsosiphonis TaxID=487317 RepID=UPI00041D511E|nr:sigma-70 family RNA polymerase sigma factor [Aequorivita capsosiphonis]
MNTETYFEKIYTENYQKVLGLCLGYLKGDEALAKDLAQDVFVKVWSNLKNFRQDAKFSTWIYRITVNTCLQELRKKRDLPLEFDLQEEISNKNSSQDESRLAKMYTCINQLSLQNQSIILLELDDVPQAEIAEILGVSHQVVRTRIHRIKTQLSKCVRHD